MGPRVLIVEDDVSRRNELVKAAKKLWATSFSDSTLTIADNLHDATKELTSDRSFDLVVMGWDFPTSRTNYVVEENGGELLEIVRERGLKTVICSNRASQLTESERGGVPIISPIPFSSIEERLGALGIF